MSDVDSLHLLDQPGHIVEGNEEEIKENRQRCEGQLSKPCCEGYFNEDESEENANDAELVKRLNKQRRRAIAAVHRGGKTIASRNSYKDKGGRSSHNSKIQKQSEERMRKEMERFDRERRKEEERLMREQQREEERLLREQRRESERREKYLQKKSIKAEKKRQKEELHREKEAERRKATVEKATARRIAKESMELMEDEQLELMELAAASKGLPSIFNLKRLEVRIWFIFPCT
ncbi:homeobox-DDT domain protein RLT1-like isoform X2 [Eucalyptus grandis]|nr:homeobox-DDT domain protein RLT1-like isoform X2 [Eucalyptus grandis]